MRRCTALLEEKQQITNIKTLLMKCYIAEGSMAIFLMKATEKAASGLPPDDLLRLKDMSDRIGTMLTEIKTEQDKPPDKLPVYLEGGSHDCLVLSSCRHGQFHHK
jgi:hypothetical protein